MNEHKDFAKIVRTSDGQQVLAYVEPDGGDYNLHIIANFSQGQADHILEFQNPDDEEENEQLAFQALEIFSTETAEALVRDIEKQLGERE